MSIDYLVSRPEFIQNYGTLPFDNQIVNFLNDLSIEIKKIKNIKDFPDLTTLAFFLRKKNIISLKNKFYVSKEKRIGLGLLFHITPANIPINFAYLFCN